MPEVAERPPLRAEADRIVAEAAATAEAQAAKSIAAARERAEAEIRPDEAAMKEAAERVFAAVSGGGRQRA